MSSVINLLVRMKFIVAALLFVYVQAGCDSIGWVKTGLTCGGKCDSCTDPNDFKCKSSVAIGPCDLNNASEPLTVASKFIAQIPYGLAFLKPTATKTADKAYLEAACMADVSACAAIDIVDSVEGFFNEASNEDSYAYITSGLALGDMETSGGFIGVASYLAKSSVSLKHNSLKIYTKSGGVLTKEDKNVCITTVSGTPGVCNGPDRTFNPEDFKFSLFGYTSGSSYSPPPANGFLGFRVKYELYGAAATGFTVNGGSTIAANGDNDVTSLKVVLSDGGEINISFETNYNIGTTTAGTEQVTSGTGLSATIIKAESTKTVKVKASVVPGSTNAIFLDYLFDGNDFQVADRYFVYDPSIVTQNAAQVQQNQSGASSIGVVACLLASLFVMLL